MIRVALPEGWLGGRVEDEVEVLRLWVEGQFLGFCYSPGKRGKKGFFLTKQEG